jgi:hypothetical protein
MMIYCKIKKSNDTSAVYMFGKTIDDITGEVEFYSAITEPPLVLKQPQTGDVPYRWLAMIMFKYQEQLQKANFPEKMSYER